MSDNCTSADHEWLAAPETGQCPAQYRLHPGDARERQRNETSSEDEPMGTEEFLQLLRDMSEDDCRRDQEACEEFLRDLEEGRPYHTASPSTRERHSPEEYAQILEEHRATTRYCDQWDAYLASLGPKEFAQFMEEQEAQDEAIHPTPRGRDIDDVGHANYARFLRKMGVSHPFYERLLLIHEFRRGNDDVLEPLARAIRWQPRNDPYTYRRFKEWRREQLVGPGDPDAYTQLVIEALLMMKVPKDGTLRDEAPQPIRIAEHWVTSSMRPLIPLDLPLWKYMRWFCNEVTRIIKKEILSDFGPLPSTEHLQRQGWDAERVSILEQHQYRKWREATRVPSAGLFQREDDVLQGRTTAGVHPHTLAQRLLDAGVRLSPLQRQVVEFAWLKNYRQIAERLGTTREVVKNAAHRIRQKARAAAILLPSLGMSL